MATKPKEYEPAASAPPPAHEGHGVPKNVKRTLPAHGVDDRDTLKDQPTKEDETDALLIAKKGGDAGITRAAGGRLMRPYQRKRVETPTPVDVVSDIYWGPKIGGERVWKAGETIPNFVGVLSSGMRLKSDKPEPAVADEE